MLPLARLRITAPGGPDLPYQPGRAPSGLLPAERPAGHYRVQVQPGELRLSEPHMPGTTEHVVLPAGRALIGPAEQPADLSPGDYITYLGDEPHIFRALEPDTTAVMIMEHI